MTRADRFTGGILAAVCLFMLWRSTEMPYGDLTTPGPGFFPFWLCLLGLLISTGIVIKALTIPAPVSHPDRQTGVIRRESKVLITTGGILVAIAIVPVVGFFGAVALYLVTFALVVQRTGIVRAVLVTVGTLLVLYLLFVKVLNVVFPAGIYEGWF